MRVLNDLVAHGMWLTREYSKLKNHRYSILHKFIYDHLISESEFIEQDAIAENMLNNIHQQNSEVQDEIFQYIQVTSLTDLLEINYKSNQNKYSREIQKRIDMAIWDLFNAQDEMTGTENPSIDVLTRCAGIFDEMLTFADRYNLKELYDTTIDDIDIIKEYQRETLALIDILRETRGLAVMSASNSRLGAASKLKQLDPYLLDHIAKLSLNHNR